MQAAKQSIFRDRALKHYSQGRKKDVLPNFSSIPTAIFAWLLFGSLLATCLVAFCGQVPVYLPGTGIVLGNEKAVANGSSGPIALVLLSPDEARQLHPGQSAQTQSSSSAIPLVGTVVQVSPGATSLATALKHYGLNLGGATQESQQVVVALIQLSAGASAGLYAGSSLIVQINVGTQSLFTALTGLGHA
jgi:hypothetical protein